MISGPFDALKCLTELWPSVRGLRYLKAPQHLPGSARRSQERRGSARRVRGSRRRGEAARALKRPIAPDWSQNTPQVVRNKAELIFA
jgi:hypothetical protein